MEERPPFRVELEPPSDGLAVLTLAGDLDIYTAQQFKKTLTGAIDGGAGKLIVDLTQVTFIDSSPLGVLVSGVRELYQRDGALAVVCADVNITRLFEITGLDRILASARRARPQPRLSQSVSN